MFSAEGTQRRLETFAVSAGLARGFWVELFRAKDAKDAEGGVGLATEDRDFIQVCAPTPPASDT